MKLKLGLFILLKWKKIQIFKIIKIKIIIVIIKIKMQLTNIWQFGEYLKSILIALQCKYHKLRKYMSMCDIMNQNLKRNSQFYTSRWSLVHQSGLWPAKGWRPLF